MVIALLILAVLLILGHMATRTTTTELQIAGNDARFKENFYINDGVTELGTELMEQNIGCTTGFTTPAGTTNYINFGNPAVIFVDAASDDFWTNGDDQATLPSDNNRDFIILPDPVGNYTSPLPNPYTGPLPRINVKVGGNSRFSAGAAMQIAAGYEGRGKALAAGGSFLAYDMIFQHIGRMNTESLVRVQWRHVLGNERNCTY
jgi:hypothetical protein